MTLELRVRLRRDAAPGAGEGRATLIDRDVVHDDDGLPYLPARRVKGILREAHQELREALDLAGLSAWPWVADNVVLSTDGLFGAGGQSTSGALRLVNLRLREAETVRAWLRWANQIGKGLFGSEAVLSAFTTIRTQTAIDRVTGGPNQETLRSTRLLRRSLLTSCGPQPLEFRGDVWFVGLSSDDLARASRSLALVCAAARRLGLSRNRGPGRVEVSLWDGETNLTARALGELELAIQARRNG